MLSPARIMGKVLIENHKKLSRARDPRHKART